MPKNALNILKNALKGKNFQVMANKAVKRLEPDTQKEATEWAAKHAVSFEEFAKKLSADLYKETLAFSGTYQKDCDAKLAKIDHKLSGAGFYDLIYFLTRYAKPKVTVETGVAAGFSSQAFLLAMQANDNDAKLYSSDFPYFRMENPEQYIGFLVDENLKPNWTLNIEGDQYALPAFAKQLDIVDLFHYDSDKSYQGREFAMQTILPLMTKGSTVVMDDIQDNLYFHDWVQTIKQDFTIFEFGGKYIGIVLDYTP